jgi:hypothetical protein
VSEVARLACERKSSGAAAPRAAPDQKPSGRAERIEIPDDLEGFYRILRERRWTDGLPAVPPTIPRVERMIAHCGRAADERIATVPPVFGIATVELLAANAVMAGCDPEYMPLLVSAVQAATAAEFNLQGLQATTNAGTPWLIVNGPLAKKFGVNSGINCLGQGTWANATIGRALRLIMQNIGGALPGDMDRATQGHPGKYSFCCAENEAASPWEPLHVERGYAPGQSTVTVACSSGTLNMNSHTKNADDLLSAFADTLAHATSNDYWAGGEPWIVLSPEHAEVLGKAGLSKAEVKLRLWEQSKMKGSRMALRDLARTEDARRAELGIIGPDTMIPISPAPELIGVIVAGGPGTHSTYIPTYANTRSATREVIQRG